GYVGLCADAPPDNVLQRRAAVAGHRKPPAAHFGEHAENVEHGLVDAVARQRTEPGEVRLVLKFKRPGEGAFDVHAVPFGQVVDAREARGGVARIHRAIAIGELWPLAGGATFGITL